MSAHSFIFQFSIRLQWQWINANEFDASDEWLFVKKTYYAVASRDRLILSYWKWKGSHRWLTLQMGKLDADRPFVIELSQSRKYSAMIQERSREAFPIISINNLVPTFIGLGMWWWHLPDTCWGVVQVHLGRFRGSTSNIALLKYLVSFPSLTQTFSFSIIMLDLMIGSHVSTEK